MNHAVVIDGKIDSACTDGRRWHHARAAQTGVLLRADVPARRAAPVQCRPWNRTQCRAQAHA